MKVPAPSTQYHSEKEYEELANQGLLTIWDTVWPSKTEEKIYKMKQLIDALAVLGFDALCTYRDIDDQPHFCSYNEYVERINATRYTPYILTKDQYDLVINCLKYKQ